MKQNAKSIADRIWIIRTQVKNNKIIKQIKEIQEKNLDYKINSYIEKNGLPSEYLTKEDLLQEITRIEYNACAECISGDYNATCTTPTGCPY